MTFFIESFLNGKIPEYQTSAMLMAVFFQGMSDSEIYALTEVFVNSGDRIDFSEDMQTVDKHSTGGVGDKLSLILVPLCAALGVNVPMMSGRGLGHTGGTLDKLESIPGFRTKFSLDQFKNMVLVNGCAIVSQSEELVPADYKIYGLRDLTGTVESLPLITASIMSKKIAEGAQNLVLDIKTGSGAFMPDLDRAKELAGFMIEVGKGFGMNMSVVFSNMNSPIGEYIGNALEVREAVEYMRGKTIPDLDRLVKTLATEMLILSGTCETSDQADILITETIHNGIALETFKGLIDSQLGESAVCGDLSLLPQAKFKIPVIAGKTGNIKSIDCKRIGYSIIEIGGGRMKPEDIIDYGVGARLWRKNGDYVEKDETIGYVYAQTESDGKKCAARIIDSYEITAENVEKEPMIFDSWRVIHDRN